MDYFSFGKGLIESQPHSRTISGLLDGQKLWIKQPVPPKARIWHHLQKLLAACLPHPILRPTVSPGGGASLRQEAVRLQQFRAAGYFVPDVLAVNDDMMVMTDIGQQLRQHLDKTMDRAARHDLLRRAIAHLAALHKNGLAHGRPYLRDMTWQNEKIGFLDLEENPVLVMPLATAQARDVWIFLGSACRFALISKADYSYDLALIKNLFETYRQLADAAVLAELARFVAFLRPLRRALQTPFVWPRAGTDARHAALANQCLEEALLV